jgi:hypothetical protein
MPRSVERRADLFGWRVCAAPRCDRQFVPETATQRCCSQRCAMRRRWAMSPQWRRVGVAREGGRRSAARRRRTALDQLVATLGGPVTARDLAVWRTAWRLALQTARVRARR